MPDRIPELHDTLTRTQQTLENLAGRVDVQQVTMRRVRRTTVLTIIGLVLDISLTVLVGWGLFGVHGNQDRVGQLQTALQTETNRNRTGQCAVIDLFLSLRTQMQKNPNYTDAQRAIQLQAFTQLARVSQTLECPPS